VLLAPLLVLILASAASADVDMTGKLVKMPSLRTKSLSVSSESGNWRCSDPYSTVANWPYYYAIGNCPNGAELEAVSYASENPATHQHSYGGFVNGAYSGCGWINTEFPLEKLNGNKHTACAEESGGGFRVKESNFWEKVNSSSAQDGFYVINSTPCPEYANYRPWSENNAPKELIRTVPAYEREGLGESASNPALKWRYVSKYASVAEPKVKYVMVRDDRISGGEGNWVFVPRSCLPATLPTSEGEHLPPAPTVTTESPSGVATPNATLNATVNPNGVETKYFFEYGTTTSYGSYTSTKSAGAGTSKVQVNATLTGLTAGTTYYFRIVASSAIGESFGGAIAFTTQPGPGVSTNAASGLFEEQATLNGSVNPEGLDTHYHFEYGTTSSYGSSTAESDAGSGTASVPESTTIAKLQPGITYYYRIAATSSAGTSYGAGQTFSTPSEPAEAFDKEGNLYVAAEGPHNALYVTTRSASSGEWHGPYEIDTAGTTYSAPTAVFGPEGNLYVGAQGPNDTLYVTVRYGSNGTWHGPYQEAEAGTTYSRPSEAFGSEGNLYVAAEGPSNTLYSTVRYASTGEWHGPYQIDSSGTTYSTPSEAFGPEGNLYVAAEGPSNSLYTTVRYAEGTWHGPYEVDGSGTTY
jgi:hypothetical protein